MLNLEYANFPGGGYDPRPMFAVRAGRGHKRNLDPIYVSPGVAEEMAFLNAVYENARDRKISERVAVTLIDYVSNKSRYVTELCEIVDELDGVPEIPHLESYEFSGRKIPGKGEMLEMSYESSHASYNVEIPEDDDSQVACIVRRRINELTEKAATYSESSGESGFDAYEKAYFEASPASSEMMTLPQYLSLITEAAAMSGSVGLVDASVMATFISSIFENGKAFSESCAIAAMCPQAEPVYGEDVLRRDGSPGDYDEQDEANGAMIDSVSRVAISIADAAPYDFSRPESEALESAASTLLRGGGWFNEAANRYMNNPAFDSIAGKIFKKIQKYVHLTNSQNPDDGFKRCLNMKKDKYTFSFNEGDDSVNDSVRAAVISVGFKPIKDNGKIVRFEASKAGLDITVEFENIGSGMIVSYVKSGSTTESAEDMEQRSPLEDIKREMLEAAKTIASGVSAEQIRLLKENLLMLERDCSEIMYPDVPLICEKTGYLRAALESVSQRVAGRHFMPQEKIARGLDIFNILQNNPGDSVCESAGVAIVSLYDDSVENAEFRVISSRLSDALNRQLYDEIACEKVLDRVDVVARYVTESQDPASREEIDPEIKSVITLLNKLGYKTKYSCAGHNRTRIKEDGKDDGVYHGKLYSTARITFDGKHTLPSVPEGWYENLRSDKTAIYVRPFTYDREDGNPDEAFSKWKTKYLANLREWAENLKPRE